MTYYTHPQSGKTQEGDERYCRIASEWKTVAAGYNVEDFFMIRRLVKVEEMPEIKELKEEVDDQILLIETLQQDIEWWEKYNKGFKEKLKTAVGALEFAAKAYDDERSSNELAGVLYEVSCFSKSMLEKIK